jgi:hypothetical protein
MISPIWTTFGRKKTLFPRLCLRGAYRSRTGVLGFAAGLGGTSNEDFLAARERFPLNHACCRYRPAIPLLPGTTGAHLARTSRPCHYPVPSGEKTLAQASRPPIVSASRHNFECAWLEAVYDAA